MVYTETVELWVIINCKHQFSSSLFCIIRSLICVFLPSWPRSGQLCREPPQASFLRGLCRGSRQPGSQWVPVRAGPPAGEPGRAGGGLPLPLQPRSEDAGRPHTNRSFVGGASRRDKQTRGPQLRGRLQRRLLLHGLLVRSLLGGLHAHGQRGHGGDGLGFLVLTLLGLYQ